MHKLATAGKVAAFVVLTGPFRKFETLADAEAAADADTEASGVDHVVIKASLTGCDQETQPVGAGSDAEKLREENALLREQVKLLKTGGKKGKGSSE